MPRFFRYLTPLLVFLAMAALLYKGLSLDPKKVPSPLVDRPAPAFALPELHSPEIQLSDADFKGQVSLLNVWATWCVSCRQEHRLLMALERQGIPIYGLNYKDERDAAIRWLQQFGDPYKAVAFDADGRVGIDWGVYGTPETFVIDKQGIVRYKHIGPLTTESFDRDIRPLIEKLRGATG